MEDGRAEERTEDGGRRTEDGGRRTEDGGRRTEEEDGGGIGILRTLERIKQQFKRTEDGGGERREETLEETRRNSWRRRGGGGGGEEGGGGGEVHCGRADEDWQRGASSADLRCVDCTIAMCLFVHEGVSMALCRLRRVDGGVFVCAFLMSKHFEGINVVEEISTHGVTIIICKATSIICVTPAACLHFCCGGNSDSLSLYQWGFRLF